MLKTRVIPTLLWKEPGLVKGVGFHSWRRVGSVLPAIRVYSARDVDELVLLDIMASQEERIPDYEAIRAFAPECSFPFTVGGGVTQPEQIRELLHAGADKVAINSAAYANPDLIERSARQFGSQCIVASIDARSDDAGNYWCASHSGTRRTDLGPAEWARELESRGAGEILLCSIDRDGTMKGYDLVLVEQVASAVRIPVIASGGAGSYRDMLTAIQAGASAVAAASMFHFTEQTPQGAREYLAKEGIRVRDMNQQVSELMTTDIA